MFMVKKNEVQKERLEKIYKRVKALYGTVPPQIEFLGNIEADYLEDFLKSVFHIVKHPHIKPDVFAFLRLHIAYKEEFVYCKIYNTKMLQSKSYTQKQLDEAVLDIETIPFDNKHKALAKYAVKVMYHSNACTQEDLDTLYEMGWTQKDVFDMVEHAGTLLRNGRILTAYTMKG